MHVRVICVGIVGSIGFVFMSELYNLVKVIELVIIHEALNLDMTFPNINNLIIPDLI